MTDTPATDRAEELLSLITQGEWFVHEKEAEQVEIGCGVAVYHDDWPQWNVATAWGGLSGDQVPSNANLIALAPTLTREAIALREKLKAAEALIDKTIDAFDDDSGDLGWWHRFQRTIDALSAFRGEPGQ